MATYEVAIYSASDLTIVDLGGGNFSVTVNVGATPTIVTVDDTDTGANETIFNDGNPPVDGGAGWGTPNQTFSGNIDGDNYVNSTINPENLYNLDGGVGDLITIYDTEPGFGGNFIGYAFSFDPGEGVTYTLNTAGSDTTPDIDPNDIYVCFTKGTEIETPDGRKLIETLSIGDEVWTETNGYQPISWIGSRTVRTTDKTYPIRIRAGTLGTDKDLLVSQQHRMVVSGATVELMFGETTMLSAAKHLIDGETIYLDRSQNVVTYFHILFEKHEIVMANGALSESFHPGSEAIGALAKPQRDEVLGLFPELSMHMNSAVLAYPDLRAYEARALAAR